jgi:hypothetical protein
MQARYTAVTLRLAVELGPDFVDGLGEQLRLHLARQPLVGRRSWVHRRDAVFLVTRIRPGISGNQERMSADEQHGAGTELMAKLAAEDEEG